MVEVHGFPGIEHDRPRRAWVAGPPPQHRVQPTRRAVEPATGIHAVDPRGRDRFTRAENHLTGAENLARTEHHDTGVQSLSQITLVARPAEVHAPQLASAVVEAGRADGEQ